MMATILLMAASFILGGAVALVGLKVLLNQVRREQAAQNAARDEQAWNHAALAKQKK